MNLSGQLLWWISMSWGTQAGIYIDEEGHQAPIPRVGATHARSNAQLRALSASRCRQCRAHPLHHPVNQITALAFWLKNTETAWSVPGTAKAGQDASAWP